MKKGEKTLLSFANTLSFENVGGGGGWWWWWWCGHRCIAKRRKENLTRDRNFFSPSSFFLSFFSSSSSSNINRAGGSSRARIKMHMYSIVLGRLIRSRDRINKHTALCALDDPWLLTSSPPVYPATRELFIVPARILEKTHQRGPKTSSRGLMNSRGGEGM